MAVSLLSENLSIKLLQYITHQSVIIAFNTIKTAINILNVIQYENENVDKNIKQK